MTDRLTTHT